MDGARLSRRASLAKLGGVLVGAAGVLGWKAAEDSRAGPAAVAKGVVTCVLAPEQSEGPFHLDDQLVRRNIRARKPGTPLTLRLRVVDVSTCKPLRNAIVDVWHCDAEGVYSGVQGNRLKFLRGIQRTDAKGWVTFQTVYPGWYPGRAVHVHVKVSLGGNVVHTGQLYFPDTITDRVHRAAPYSRRPRRSTRNSGDFIFRNGGRLSTLKLRRARSRWVGSITMGVQRS